MRCVTLLMGNLQPRFTKESTINIFWKIIFRDQPGESNIEILLGTSFCRGLLENHLPRSTRGIYCWDSIKNYLLPRSSGKSFVEINQENILPRFDCELPFAEVLWKINFYDQLLWSTRGIYCRDCLWTTFCQGLLENHLPRLTRGIYCWDLM